MTKLSEAIRNRTCRVGGTPLDNKYAQALDKVFPGGVGEAAIFWGGVLLAPGAIPAEIMELVARAMNAHDATIAVEARAAGTNGQPGALLANFIEVANAVGVAAASVADHMKSTAKLEDGGGTALDEARNEAYRSESYLRVVSQYVPGGMPEGYMISGEMIGRSSSPCATDRCASWSGCLLPRLLSWMSADDGQGEGSQQLRPRSPQIPRWGGYC
jgi:hypothetical protein